MFRFFQNRKAIKANRKHLAEMYAKVAEWHNEGL